MSVVCMYHTLAKEGPWAVHLTDWGMGQYSRYQYCICDLLWKNRPLTQKHDSAVGGLILDSTIFFQIFFLGYSESMVLCPSIYKFQRDLSLFSACTARKKEWRSVSASYVNGCTVLLININLQVTVDHHDDTRDQQARHSKSAMADLRPLPCFRSYTE